MSAAVVRAADNDHLPSHWTQQVGRENGHLQWTGLRVGMVGNDSSLHLPADGLERLVVPLSGSFTIDIDSDTRVSLAGRRRCMSESTDTAYLPIETAATIRGVGRVAVAEAPSSTRHPLQIMTAADALVEVRGAGHCTRLVRNFGVPGTLVAERLIVCEVVTPAGNWSSYPPHKHDTAREGIESELEEIYYFELDAEEGPGASSDSFGLFTTRRDRLSSDDITVRLSSHDIVVVPAGFHGPAAAPPGYDMYYLNVMAGPKPHREWLITDDPAHAWVRATWIDHDVDPRVLSYQR